MAERKQTAIITGGLSGIGLETALMLIRRGVNVAVASTRVGRAEAETAEAMIEVEARRHDGQWLSQRIDIRDTASVDEGVAAIASALGDVTILVNAAGTYNHEALLQHTDETWEDTLASNLTGPFRMTRAVWPMMLAAGHGRIINIASTAAHRGAAEYAGYCSAKAGVLGLTRVSALEGAPHGITANSISPSWVDTPMMAASLGSQADTRGVAVDDIYAEARRDNPQGRIITPDEIAGQITWLALDAPPALTGEDILMTGGASW